MTGATDLRVGFAGTPAFAEQALQAILSAGFNVVVALTQPDRPSGRGMQLTPSPVKQLALKHGIPVEQPVSLRNDDAQAMLQKIIAGKWLQAHGVVGLFPANSVNDGEDIEIYGNEKRDAPVMTWHNLRQQNKKPTGNPNLCLGDFVAPKESGVKDYAGAFAVTAGAGIEKKLAEFEKNHDDYSAIVLKALADRLAEAFAELLHKRVRREFWGYAKDETLDNDALISEKYRGIRPAPGYPACPDHSEKAVIFDCLKAEKNTGIKLTETFAMIPSASVCGLYLSNPQAKYFNVDMVICDKHRKRANEIASMTVIGDVEGKDIVIIDDLVDTGGTARVVRSLLPKAFFATLYAKPAGRDVVDLFVKEFKQNKWIYFPWDIDYRFSRPIKDSGRVGRARRRRRAGPRRAARHRALRDHRLRDAARVRPRGAWPARDRAGGLRQHAARARLESHPVDRDGAIRRELFASDQLEQRRFSRAAISHHEKELALF